MATKFRFIVVQCHDGSVIGTNSEEEAQSFASDISYVVLDRVECAVFDERFDSEPIQDLSARKGDPTKEVDADGPTS